MLYIWNIIQSKQFDIQQCTLNVIYFLECIIFLFTYIVGRCYWIEEISIHAVFNIDLTFLELSSSFSDLNQILQFIFYIVWNKNWKSYWSEQCFTGFGLEDWCSSWGLISSRIIVLILVTTESANQNGIFNIYSVLIGQYWNTSKKIVLQCFMIVRLDLGFCYFGHWCNMRQVQPETLPKNSKFFSCLQNIKLKNNTT